MRTIVLGAAAVACASWFVALALGLLSFERPLPWPYVAAFTATLAAGCAALVRQAGLALPGALAACAFTAVLVPAFAWAGLPLFVLLPVGTPSPYVAWALTESLPWLLAAALLGGLAGWALQPRAAPA